MDEGFYTIFLSNFRIDFFKDLSPKCFSNVKHKKSKKRLFVRGIYGNHGFERPSKLIFSS